MIDKTKNEGLQTARCCYGEKQQIASITNHKFNLYYTEVTNAPFIGWHELDLQMCSTEAEGCCVVQYIKCYICIRLHQ